ncbi:Nucleic-acid-binding protein [Aphis craccivora]|uniref:Nucleic-acid-binding protein n=1 Tax=Aphis craccivora TaxID=307492 RepID=A0A6G0YAC8_APHCR|nr:Nucleic-acid-binding protein [Aphis craccivora]
MVTPDHTYCGYPSRYVRCSAFHQSSACPNSPGTPPNFALYQGTYPASYKGCSVYDLQCCKKPISSNFPFDKAPYDIRLLIADKKRAIGLFQIYRLPSNKHDYNKLTNLLKKILANHKPYDLKIS